MITFVIQEWLWHCIDVWKLIFFMAIILEVYLKLKEIFLKIEAVDSRHKIYLFRWNNAEILKNFQRIKAKQPLGKPVLVLRSVSVWISNPFATCRTDEPEKRDKQSQRKRSFKENSWSISRENYIFSAARGSVVVKKFAKRSRNYFQQTIEGENFSYIDAQQYQRSSILFSNNICDGNFCILFSFVTKILLKKKVVDDATLIWSTKNFRNDGARSSHSINSRDEVWRQRKNIFHYLDLMWIFQNMSSRRDSVPKSLLNHLIII